MHRDALGDGGVLFHRRVVHLAAPERFLPIVPDFIPMPHAVVVVTVLARSLAALASDQEVAPACWRHASTYAVFPSQHQACDRGNSRAAASNRLVVSWAAPNHAAGAGVVGAILRGGHRLAVA
jgi:hypothetical protein